MTHEEIMNCTIKLATENVEKGLWPFATRNGEILAEGVNSVTISHDPSDHAEIAAIRIATKKLQTSNLSDCTMYVVGLPCPMCLTCILFSKITNIIYAVDVSTKDRALQKLPLTDSLYKLISNDYASKALNYKHLSDFSKEGESLFIEWNKNNEFG
jgi:tRNA(Arg) A34 adenosine deaminase TadA